MATTDDLIAQNEAHRKADADFAAAKKSKEISQNVGATGIDTLSKFFGMAASWKNPEAATKAGIGFTFSAAKFIFALSARFDGAASEPEVGPIISSVKPAPAANLGAPPTSAGPMMTGTMG